MSNVQSELNIYSDEIIKLFIKSCLGFSAAKKKLLKARFHIDTNNLNGKTYLMLPQEEKH